MMPASPDDPVDIYLAEVAKIPPLTHSAELACLRQLQAGGEQAEFAHRRLIEANLFRVVEIAQQNDPTNSDHALIDLIQEGNIALAAVVAEASVSEHDDLAAVITSRVQRAIRAALAALREE